MVRVVSDDATVRELARLTCGNCFGPLLNPVIQTILALFGRSPAAVFRHLGTIAAPLIRRLQFEYLESDAHAGELRLVFPTTTPAATFIAWEGIARFIIEVADCAPDVVPHRADTSGRAVVIPVRWTARLARSA